MGNRERQRNILTIATTVVVIFFCVGVCFYYYFFRQVNAKLIETIPTDAAFMFQINDNETFLKSVKKIHAYINPLFGLDAYPGCQFFIDQLPGKYNQVVFTGHSNGETMSILFACKISERAFHQLLNKLQIDVKNCLKFDLCKIYSHGTHLKRFVFTYHKGIFLASENVTLIKKAIIQLKNPRNLTNLKSFQTLFGITEKNKKQNWLMVNHDNYFSLFRTFINDETHFELKRFSSQITWSAFQVRFSELEMLIAGYIAVTDSFLNYYNQLEQKHLFLSSLAKTDNTVDIEKNALLKYAMANLPSDNDFEIVIHADNSGYWNRYLSETGIIKFPVAQMKLFAFSFSAETQLSTSLQIQTANGLIKF